jgi:hypothetical protein
MLVPLKIPPGVYRSGTDYQSKGRWRDANLIRFVDGRIEPVGGWVGAGPVLDGPGRGIVAWRANVSGRRLAVGTVNKLWVYNGDTVADITPAGFPAGNVNSAITSGYGSGPYGAGPYGVSSAGGRSEATTWSLDSFGEWLVATASHDDTVYLWSLNPSVPAAPLTGAPQARSVLVTPERFLVAIGSRGNPREVAWSGQENITDWNFASPTNAAGFIELETDGALIAGFQTRGQSLILSTTDAFTMRFVGFPFIHSFQRVGDSSGIVGTNAGTEFNGGAVWMGREAFFGFSGTSVQALQSEVSDHVFSDINRDELALVSCHQKAAFGEITWHYPSAGSMVNDRYVTWNYRENHWTIGTLGRSAMVDAGVWDYPMGVDNAGKLLEHEKGWLDDGAPRGADVFLESGPVELGDGDQVVSVVQVLPDEVTPGAFALRMGTKFAPEGPEFNHGPYTLTPYTSVRVTGRQVALRIEGVRDEDSRIGIFRADIRPGGRR